MQEPSLSQQVASTSQLSCASQREVIAVLSDSRVTMELAVQAIRSWIQYKQTKGRTTGYICAKLEAIEAKFVSLAFVHAAFHQAREGTGLPSSFTLPNISVSPTSSPVVVPTTVAGPRTLSTAAASTLVESTVDPSTSARRFAPSPIKVRPMRVRPQSIHGLPSPITPNMVSDWASSPSGSPTESPLTPVATHTRSVSYRVPPKPKPKDYAAAFASLQESYGTGSVGPKYNGCAYSISGPVGRQSSKQLSLPPLQSLSSPIIRPARGFPPIALMSKKASTLSSMSSTTYSTTSSHGMVPSERCESPIDLGLALVKRPSIRGSLEAPWEMLQSSFPVTESQEYVQLDPEATGGHLVDGLFTEYSAGTFLRLFKA